MNKTLILLLSLLGCPVLHADSNTIDIQSHKTGIWSIKGSDQAQRWIVIHDLTGVEKTGIYHIEVIQRTNGAPEWQIERLVRHMAITEAALKRSVINPLDRGAVYPEPFDDAMAEWQAKNGGLGGNVCNTSVTACITKIAPGDDR